MWRNPDLQPSQTINKDTLHQPHRTSSPDSASPDPLGDPGRTEGEGEGDTPAFLPPNEKKKGGGAPSVVKFEVFKVESLRTPFPTKAVRPPVHQPHPRTGSASRPRHATAPAMAFDKVPFTKKYLSAKFCVKPTAFAELYVISTNQLLIFIPLLPFHSDIYPTSSSSLSGNQSYTAQVLQSNHVQQGTEFSAMMPLLQPALISSDSEGSMHIQTHRIFRLPRLTGFKNENPMGNADFFFLCTQVM